MSPLVKFDFIIYLILLFIVSTLQGFRCESACFAAYPKYPPVTNSSPQTQNALYDRQTRQLNKFLLRVDIFPSALPSKPA